MLVLSDENNNFDTQMAHYSIKDLEVLTGIKAHTIRIWEKRYKLVEPGRTESNIRFYDDEDLKKLLNISTLNKNGIKISRIANLGNSELAEKILEISRQKSNYEGLIDSLVIAMIDLDEARFEKIFANITIKIGFEQVIFNIFYPLLERIGVLWQTGAINPAQEHFISHLIKQKLMVAIDGLPVARKTNYKTFVLYLPEWELHEVGLMVYHYLIKKQGHHVIYLGQKVPLENLVSVIETSKTDYIFTSFTISHPAHDIEPYLNDLSILFDGKKIFVTGFQVYHQPLQIPENISIIRDAKSFLELI